MTDHAPTSSPTRPPAGSPAGPPTRPPALQANLADPRYTQRDRREILRVLRRLVTDQVPVLLVGAGEGDVLHTTVLDVAADERSVFLEWGPDDETTERFIEGGVAVSCQAEVDRVRLHFAIVPTLGRLQYRKVLRAPVPELVLRVQRREYYRLSIVPADGVVCTLLLPHPDGVARPTDAELVDLSGGGLAFRVPLPLGAQLRPHVELTGGTLTFANADALAARLRVRNLTKITDETGNATVRVGAQFLDLRVGHIAQVQRFIGFIERRRRDEDRRRADLEARAEEQRAALRKLGRDLR